MAPPPAPGAVVARGAEGTAAGQQRRQRRKAVVVTLVLALSLLANAAAAAAWWWHSTHVYSERDAGSGVALVFEQAPVVEEVRTPFQHVQVRATPFFGKMLIIDDDLMLTERDEFSYHEMAAHVPLAYAAAATTVVIVGGGDGGVCTQVLAHDNVRSVLVVDIDAVVVDVALRHFPRFRTCYEDPRVTLVTRDAAKWAQDQHTVAKWTAAVDVVIVDSTDFGASHSLFTVQFYKHLRALLTPHGVLVLNLSSLAWNLRGCARAIRRQRRVFDIVVPYQVFQPTYMSGHYGYLFCSNHVNPLSAVVDWRAFHDKHIHTSYYSPAVHWAAFALPPFVLRALPPLYTSPSPAPLAPHQSVFPSTFPILDAFLARPAPPPPGSHTDTSPQSVGIHVLAELSGAPHAMLASQSAVHDAMLTAAQAAHFTVIKPVFHSFSPYGVTGVLVLAESHFSIHTWPEHGYAAVDAFTCSPPPVSDAADTSTAHTPAAPHVAIQALAQALQAQHVDMKTTTRGFSLPPSPSTPSTTTTSVQWDATIT